MSASSRYRRPARIYHWTGFALVLLAYLLINLHDVFARGSAGRTLTLVGHFWTGIVLLLLFLPRILERFRHSPPPITPTPPAWQKLLAGTTHVALYAFVLFQPLLGVMTIWSTGRGIPLPFIDASLPSPFEGSRDLHEQFEDIHVWVGEIFYWVIGLHIVAALYHHLFRRDDTLTRMK